jgi:hypothetical protein
MSLKPQSVLFKSLRIGAKFVRAIDGEICKKISPTSWSGEDEKEYHIPSAYLDSIRVFEIYYGKGE